MNVSVTYREHSNSTYNKYYSLPPLSPLHVALVGIPEAQMWLPTMAGPKIDVQSVFESPTKVAALSSGDSGPPP